MKVLIAILSCDSYRLNGNNQAVRDTWLPYAKKEPNVDCKFFLGIGSSIENSDEVLLNVPDDYSHVTYKAKEIYKYVLENGYDHVFKCYPDTYVCPRRLMSSGFEKYDYSGNFACRPLGAPAYCTGGAGYWVSKEACQKMVEASIPTEVTVIAPPNRRPLRSPTRMELVSAPKIVTNVLSWAEDKWSGELLYKHHSLLTHHDIRYEENVYAPGPEVKNQIITQHLSRTRGIEGAAAHYDRQWLYDKHKRWLNSPTENKEKIDKIAVITPSVPSRGTLLSECKDSVRIQSWEGMIDHRIAIDYAKEGPSVVRNRIVSGLDSSYQWLAFVDDDDRLLPNHFSALVNNGGGADIVYSDCKDEGFKKSWVTRDFNYEEVKVANYIPITVLMRRSTFEKAGGFSTEPPGEDQRLFLRCAEIGARFVYVPTETWVYRQHPQYRTY